MSEPFYLSRSTLEPVAPLHRRAHLPLGATADMGVHGAVVGLYQLAPPRPLPLPVDYVVAAAAG